MIRADVLREFASDMAAAYTRLAAGLAVSAEQPVRVVEGRKLVDVLPGSRQRAVYEVLRQVGEEGLTTGAINERIGYDFSNTYTTMHRLLQLGIVERVPNARYQTWRLAEPYR